MSTNSQSRRVRVTSKQYALSVKNPHEQLVMTSVHGLSDDEMVTEHAAAPKQGMSPASPDMTRLWAGARAPHRHDLDITKRL